MDWLFGKHKPQYNTHQYNTQQYNASYPHHATQHIQHTQHTHHTQHTQHTQQNEKKKYRGMMSIYKTHWGEIAFGRAPRVHKELDQIHLVFEPALVVDLTELSERALYIDYRPHLHQEKARGFDVSMKHFPIPKDDIPSKDKIKSFCEFINAMSTLHKTKKLVYIHCSDGYERSAMVMGCLLVNLYPTTEYNEVMKILNEIFKQRTDWDPKLTESEIRQTDKQKNLLQQYCEYQKELVNKNTTKNKKKKEKTERQAIEQKNRETAAEERIEKYIKSEKYTLKGIRYNGTASTIHVNVI